KSMVAVASATRTDVALAQLTLSAAGIPYVIATDPIDLTTQVLVDPCGGWCRTGGLVDLCGCGR
ncbi:MAG TPA: hypothetical protein VIQ02_08125, partial [Jiangellaceae bacterium]